MAAATEKYVFCKILQEQLKSFSFYNSKLCAELKDILFKLFKLSLHASDSRYYYDFVTAFKFFFVKSVYLFYTSAYFVADNRFSDLRSHSDSEVVLLRCAARSADCVGGAYGAAAGAAAH